MKQRIKLILVLMSVCMLSLLAFQFYWSYQGFASASKSFKTDINQALQAAVDKEMALRQDLIAQKYTTWLADTNLVNIDCHVDTTSGTTVFTVTDKAASDNDEATFTIGFQEYRPEEGKMTPKVKRYFIDRFVKNTVRPNLQEKVSIYYTLQLGELLEQTYKQEKLNKARLQQFFEQELLAREIDAAFVLHFGDGKRKQAATADFPYATRTFEFGFRQPFYQVQAFFPDPNQVLLLRMKWVLLSSLLLAAITLCCFAYTITTILRQKKLSELKNDFVNNMTHELRTPVATISIAAEAMQDFNLSAKSSQEYLAIIRQQSGRLGSLIDGILKNLAFEQNQLELSPKPLHLQHLVQQAVLQHRPQLDVAGATVEVSQPEEAIWIEGDELHLLNVCSNLIENALKYNRGTLALHLQCYQKNGQAVLTISDNGMGIPAAMQQKVFDKFFRVPTGNVHNTKGYGLGLSYAKTIVECHGGSISLQSKETPAPPSLSDSQFIPMKHPSILLLEDEPQLAKIVTESLQKKEFSVTHVSNGLQGLDAIRAASFDVCVVDVMLPLMDGFTFVKELRKTDKNTPVLFLTAKSMTEDVVQGFELGGNDYLKKPFSLEELVLRLKELLRRAALDEKAPETAPIGRYTFDPLKQELWLQQALVCKLSHRENELLKLLVQHKNQVLDRKASLLKLWGDDSFFNARSMDVFISKLRKHLSQDPGIEILNIRGVGYKLVD